MRPILVFMIMRKHNQTINNQCAVGHSVRQGIAIEVLRGVLKGGNFRHVKNGAAAPNTPYDTLHSLKHTIYDPSEDRQIVELVGVVLVVVAAAFGVCHVSMHLVHAKWTLGPNGHLARAKSRKLTIWASQGPKHLAYQ